MENKVVHHPSGHQNLRLHLPKGAQQELPRARPPNKVPQALPDRAGLIPLPNLPRRLLLNSRQFRVLPVRGKRVFRGEQRPVRGVS